jgi:hypothetical protein
VGTRTPYETLLTQYADNTSGQITAERLRNFVQSVRPHVTTSAPTVNSDETAGFDRGHAWLDTAGPTIYECVDPATGAAVWVQVYPGAGGGASELSDLSDVDTEYAVNGDVLRYQAGAWSPDALGSAADADTGDFATAAQGALADTAVQPAREVATTHSVTGGGDLTADRTLSLVNDAATPGANKVYGTDGTGAKGWKDDPAGSGSTAWGGITGTLSDQTDLQNALDDKLEAGDPISINAQTGTTYTLVLADAGKLVTLANASPVTVTVPTNGSVAFPVGTVIAGAQLGAGLVSIQGADGVTINGVAFDAGDPFDTAGQYSTWSLTKLDTNTWLLSGGLADDE